MDRVKVTFAGDTHPALCLPRGARLSEHLTVRNSPVLFGCRTGICGTCLSRVSGAIPPPSPDEAEVVDLLAPGEPGLRLLCQVELTADIRVAWRGA